MAKSKREYEEMREVRADRPSEVGTALTVLQERCEDLEAKGDDLLRRLQEIERQTVQALSLLHRHVHCHRIAQSVAASGLAPASLLEVLADLDTRIEAVVNAPKDTPRV